MVNYNANEGEFQIHTYTTTVQYWTSVTALSDGGFVVTWDSAWQDRSEFGVYGQRYNANGNRVGSEFQVNTCTASSQYWSSVSGLSNGGFIVTWESSGQDGSGYGIYGQRYNASGSRAGSEFQVNTYTTSWQEYSSVSALSAGGFVVAWESSGQDGSGAGIYGQCYNASGSQAGSEFQVNTYTTANQDASSVTALSAGGFIVTWESSGQDGSGAGIYGQRYNARGSRAGSEFQVNTYTTDNQDTSSVTALSAGGFVVAWESSGQDGSGAGIYGQRYNANGSRAGSEFQVNTYTTGSQYSPNVTALRDGGFVVTWGSSGQGSTGTGIFGQRYNASGNQVGREFQANTFSTSCQLGPTPSVTALSDGGFIVTWDSYEQDGSNFGVYGQRFRADGTPCRDFAGTTGDDTWTGGVGSDTINGRDGNDSLIGKAGNDILNGGGGIDILYGGLGDDAYYVNVSGDVIYEAGGAGIDTVFSSVSRTLGANLEKLTLTSVIAINGTGNNLNNILTGNGSDNVLSGGAGNDALFGKSGSDILVGGSGNDTLTGGSGSDAFVFDRTLNGTTNKDIIADFSHADDTIRLDKTIFAKFSTGVLLSSQFRAAAVVTALDRNDFFLYNTSTGALLYDADGNGVGAAIQFATLTSKPQNVAYNDFVVVA